MPPNFITKTSRWALSISPLLLGLAPWSGTYDSAAPITDGTEVNGQTYDYIIAGGGLSGTVLASRLAENPDRTVLLIEAGHSAEEDPVIYRADSYWSAVNSKYNYKYPTTAQEHADGKTQHMAAGFALGGGTAINGMAWSKPHDFQIDALEELGNPGLNWQNLQPYMLKAERFSQPSPSQAKAGLTYDPACHGKRGVVGVQFDPYISPYDLENVINATVQHIGLPYTSDLACGEPVGDAPVAHTRTGDYRNTAYRSYLWQQQPPNLIILTDAVVGKVLLEDGDKPRAVGVEFRPSSGKTYVAHARREVIVSLGSVRTPVLLQHSGIGPTEILRDANVKQRVDLPVGLNLIDQTTTNTRWYYSAQSGGGQPIVFPRLTDLFTHSEAEALAEALHTKLDEYVTDIVNAGAIAESQRAGLKKVMEIQRNWMLNMNASISENFVYTGDNQLQYDSWFLLTFGRGSINITNNDPYSPEYKLDPRYFSNHIDKVAQAATARFTRKVSESSPLANNLADTGSTMPPSVGEENLGEWIRWVKATYRPNWHPLGTASMMSKDLGGVVDSEHRVYGVDQLRIVDASVIPFQVSSHLMSVLYGFAERAAELIADHHDREIVMNRVTN